MVKKLPLEEMVREDRVTNAADVFESEGVSPGSFMELYSVLNYAICEAEDEVEVVKHKTPMYTWMNNPYSKLRQRVFMFWEDPTSSKFAMATALFYFFLIIFSVFAFIIETAPTFYTDEEDGPNTAFFYIEAIIVGFFTIEYVMRLWACPINKVWWFVIQPLNVIDLLAILPFYVEVIVGAVSALAFVRVMRLIRVLRVVKLAKFSEGFSMLGEGLVASRKGMQLMVVFVGFGVVLWASLEWYLETIWQTFWEADDTWYYDDGADTPFQSIPHTMWWAIVTMTTVGYGDLFPVSPYGRAVAAFTFLAGIITISFPAAMLSDAFLGVYEERGYGESGTGAERKQRASLLKNGEDLQRLCDDVEEKLNHLRNQWTIVLALQLRVQQAFLIFVPSRLYNPW